MSDRITVDDLVGEAERLVWDVVADPDLTPAEALRAWDRFSAGAEAYLMAAGGPTLQRRQVRSRMPRGWATDRWWTALPRADRTPPGVADARLLRSGELLAGAGDLIQAYRRAGPAGSQIGLNPAAEQAATNRAVTIAAAAAHRVAGAAVEQRVAQLAAADRGEVLDRSAGTGHLRPQVLLAHERELLALGTFGVGSLGPFDDLAVPSPLTDDPTGRFLAAVRDWHTQARDALSQTVVPARDLAQYAQAAAFLTVASAQVAGQPLHGLPAEGQRTCAAAAAAWTRRSTALPATQAAAGTARQLHTATVEFAAAETTPTLRRHLALKEVAEAAADVLAGAQSTVEQLARAGMLYGPARHLDLQPVDAVSTTIPGRQQARNAGKWVALTAAEAAPIVAAHAAAAETMARIAATYSRFQTAQRVDAPTSTNSSTRVPAQPRRGRGRR